MYYEFHVICMVGQQQPRSAEGMYGIGTAIDSTTTRDLVSVSDRITRETVLDCLLDTPYPLTVDAIASRTSTAPTTVETHLDALEAAEIVSEAEPDGYTTEMDALPLDVLEDKENTAEVFLLEARDKEYREWFGVDDPYDARQPPNADTETAIAALGQWFGVRKRLHQLADDH